MLASLFMIITVAVSGPSIPNYYPGLVAARNASEKTQKEMIVFFTNSACEHCESAWNGFAGNTQATTTYISTKIDVADFDGRVYFELFGFKNTPAWVILHPDGTVRESWEGSWKDAQGNTLITPSAEKPSVQQSKTEQPVTPVQPVSQPSPKPVEIVQGAYFIQAGYFGSEANAVKLINELHAKGYNSYTAKAEQRDGKTFFRVVSSLFENETMATTEQRALLAAGISAAVKKL